MRIRYFIIPAMLAAGVIVGVADEASEKPGADQMDEVVVVESAVVECAEGEAAVKRPQMRRTPRKGGLEGDSILSQTMLLRILENPEACDKIGLDPDVHKALVVAFEAIDKQVDAKRVDLVYLQATQAKLIVDGADEADVMLAVDAVWKARAEIAKFQTAKLLKVRGLLTEEQVKRLDEVCQEIFRERRLKQLREGESERPVGQGRHVRPATREPPVAVD